MQPAVARGFMTFNDDVELARRHEELQLLKAFLGIADPDKRRTIIELAERLAAGAATKGVRPTFGPTDAETSDDVPGRNE